MDPAAFSKIPLLDFALSRDPATKSRFLDDLRKAIVNVGFFYVKNTTVSPTAQDNIIKKGIELLELPLEEKLKIEMANSKHFLGYARLGNEITALKPDYREQFDVSLGSPTSTDYRADLLLVRHRMSSSWPRRASMEELEGSEPMA